MWLVLLFSSMAVLSICKKPISSVTDRCWAQTRKEKGKKAYLYSAFLYMSKRSDMDHTILPANTPCLPFLRKMAPFLTEVRDIQLPLGSLQCLLCCICVQTKQPWVHSVQCQRSVVIQASRTSASCLMERLLMLSRNRCAEKYVH